MCRSNRFVGYILFHSAAKFTDEFGKTYLLFRGYFEADMEKLPQVPIVALA